MRTAAALSLLLTVAIPTPAAAEPIQRHPKNGRYLVFKGKPAILVGGGEHYGAVLNLDFDYTRYLDTMQKDGLNLTRLFVGTYYEKPGDFGIGNNTLAPAPGRALTPWQRSDTPGAADGGNKFDLEKWNDAYFARLEDFVAQASARGIAVEVVMFSAYYRGGWAGSPMNAANNVNGIGTLTKEQANTLDNGSLKAAQERVVRKIVRELKDADNVYYEIQNEPWADLGQPAGILNAGILPQDMQGGAAGFWKNRVDLANAASLAWQKANRGDHRRRGAGSPEGRAPPDRAELLQLQTSAEGRRPERGHPELPLRLARGRDAQPRPRQGDRLRRDRLRHAPTTRRRSRRPTPSTAGRPGSS
jgi:hypothetical protein